MPERKNAWKATILSLALVVFAASVTLLSTAGPPDKVSPSKARPGKAAGEKAKTSKVSPPRAAAQESDYVGGDACFACHDLEAAFKKNPHYRGWDDTSKSGSERGCESCHGPGKEHVEGGGDVTKIFNFKKVSAQEISDTCLDCHLKQEERTNFLASEHGLNSVACTECHSVHTPHVQQALLRGRSPALCYDCHGEVRAEFNKPFHHKVHENLMSCSDCHNQHGGFNVRQTRDSTGTDMACFTCHADKQGPFVFEHAPVKLEGCTLCHTPHGSVNPRLLKRANINQLCLECHSETPGLVAEVDVPGVPTFHSQVNPRFTNCTTCHVNIHGSNVNRFFFE